jgi:hypothetical protein
VVLVVALVPLDHRLTHVALLPEEPLPQVVERHVDQGRVPVAGARVRCRDALHCVLRDRRPAGAGAGEQKLEVLLAGVAQVPAGLVEAFESGECDERLGVLAGGEGQELAP